MESFSAPEHTDEQKQHFYNNLSDDQKQKQTYTEWAKEAYNDQYEKWMPWIEDQYLKWFGKGDNKASYATKGLSNLPRTSTNTKLKFSCRCPQQNQSYRSCTN